jgi:hypothetical protein
VQFGNRGIGLLLDELTEVFQVNLDHANTAHRQGSDSILLPTHLLDPSSPRRVDGKHLGNLLGLLPSVVGTQHPLAKVLRIRSVHPGCFQRSADLIQTKPRAQPGKRGTGATFELGML